MNSNRLLDALEPKEYAMLAPHLQGGSEFWLGGVCIGYPFKVANPQRSLDVKGVPTLIVHATHDPSVSYQ